MAKTAKAPKTRKNRSYTISLLSGVLSFRIRGKFVSKELGLKEGDQIKLRHDLSEKELARLYRSGKLLVFHKVPKQETARLQNEQRMAYLKRELALCESYI